MLVVGLVFYVTVSGNNFNFFYSFNFVCLTVSSFSAFSIANCNNVNLANSFAERMNNCYDLASTRKVVDERNFTVNTRTPLQSLCNQVVDMAGATPKSSRKSRTPVNTPSFPSMFYNLRPTPVRLSRPLLQAMSPFDENLSFKVHYADDAIIEDKQKDAGFSNFKENKMPSLSTIPQPFRRMECKRKRTDTESFVSMAEQVAAFQKTPKRYRTAPRNSVFLPTARQPLPELCKPHTPMLLAVKRKRQVNVLNEEERDCLEVQKMKEHQFHARPLNTNIFTKPHQISTSKRFTIPEPFVLETENRALHANVKVDEEPKFVFHATNIPKHILEHPVGIKERAPAKVTVPQSPAFHLKKRAAEWDSLPKTTPTKRESSVTKLRPFKVVDSGAKSNKKHCTTFQPFSFDSLNKARLEAKEAKVQKAIEEQLQKVPFKARLVPGEIYSPVQLTPAPRKITKPEPFNFHLVSGKKTLKQPDVEEAYQFKAQPSSVVKKKPFLPKKADKSIAVYNTLTLNTERRAMERENKLQNQLKQQELEKELNQQLVKEQEEKAKLELKQFRESLVHKPRPVLTPKIQQPRLPKRKLTLPQSPKFATNLRFGHK